MTPHLAPALLTAAAERRRDPDLMAAAAVRITRDGEWKHGHEDERSP